MNSLINTTISGLILASLSGLAFLALQHYDVFNDLFFKLIGAIFVVYLTASSLLLGYRYGFLSLQELIAKQTPNISIPEPEYSSSIFAYLMIGFIILQAYLYLLDYLGAKIKKSKEKQDQI